MIGVSFHLSSLQDVSFESCICTFQDYSKTKMRYVEYHQSDLSSSSFIQTDIKQILFFDVCMSRTEFLQTSLSQIDFSSCDIRETLFDLNSMRGIVIDSFQSQFLITMLGVQIKDDFS